MAATPEERLAYFDGFVRPALINFKHSLGLCASSYEKKSKESSALALIAVIKLIEDLCFEDYLSAPLNGLVDDLEQHFNTSQPGYRLGISMILDMSKALALAVEEKKSSRSSRLA